MSTLAVIEARSANDSGPRTPALAVISGATTTTADEPLTLFGRQAPSGILISSYDALGFDIWDDAWWPEDLREEHRGYLRQRAVAPFVAWVRGYRSFTGYEELLEITGLNWGDKLDDYMYSLGTEERGGFVIPLYQCTWDWAEDYSRPLNDAPEVSTYQLHLDYPRPSRDKRGHIEYDKKTSKPKLRKFESVFGSSIGPENGQTPGDVNPATWFMVCTKQPGSVNPFAERVDVLVTEGIPKADAALSACMDPRSWPLIPTVWTGVNAPYMATKDAEGFTVGHALSAAWDSILDLDNWPTRENEDGELEPVRATVWVAYDSDSEFKKPVMDASLRTGRLLAKQTEFVEEVRIVRCPPTPGTAAGGLDDWLAHLMETYSPDGPMYSTAVQHMFNLRSASVEDVAKEQEEANGKSPVRRVAARPNQPRTTESTTPHRSTPPTSILATPSRSARHQTIG